jgi:hypothetical protein
MDAELARKRRKPTLQRANDAGGDARGMPVHAHDGTERLEPEGMRQAAQEIVAAVMVDDCLRDHRAKTRHSAPEPRRDPAVVQGQIGAAGASGHEASHRTNWERACSTGWQGRKRALTREPSLS